MTICEVIQADTKILTRIYFIPDNEIKVIQTHTYSHKYITEKLLLVGVRLDHKFVYYDYLQDYYGRGVSDE